MTFRGASRPNDRPQARPLEPDVSIRREPSNPRRDPGRYEPDWRRTSNGRSGRGRGSNGGGHGVLRFLLFALVLAALVVGTMFTVLRPIVRSAIVDWAWENPGSLRIPLVGDLIREDLGSALTDPAGGDSTKAEFEVALGDTAATLAPRLLGGAFITSERAFLFHAIETDLNPKLKAGHFLLHHSMTVDEVTQALLGAPIQISTEVVTFREGLRIEQMTALLQTVPSRVDPQAFYELATNPPATLLGDYPWLDLPEGRSLEGYLYPATYTLIVDAGGGTASVTTADDLVRAMLGKFREVVGDLVIVPEGRGMTFYEILTLASIVEREAVLDEERPIIAGVYQNRLNGLRGTARILNADPTVFYAIDQLALAELPFDQWQLYSFWNPPGRALAGVNVPPELQGYQTYQTGGLIPGPICTPSLESIEAALAPDTELDGGYLYFVAIPDGAGKHAFTKTLAEHQANLRKYGYL
ncbi:MAG: endolytic transglycosylase MltG [Chloroflexota bacterium]